MQAVRLSSYHAEMLDKSYRSAITMGSQNFPGLDKAREIVVVSLEATNELFPLRLAEGSTDSSPFPLETIL